MGRLWIARNFEANHLKVRHLHFLTLTGIRCSRVSILEEGGLYEGTLPPGETITQTIQIDNFLR